MAITNFLARLEPEFHASLRTKMEAEGLTNDEFVRRAGDEYLNGKMEVPLRYTREELETAFAFIEYLRAQPTATDKGVVPLLMAWLEPFRRKV